MHGICQSMTSACAWHLLVQSICLRTDVLLDMHSCHHAEAKVWQYTHCHMRVLRHDVAALHMQLAWSAFESGLKHPGINDLSVRCGLQEQRRCQQMHQPKMVRMDTSMQCHSWRLCPGQMRLRTTWVLQARPSIIMVLSPGL